ncbi:MAG TPA: DUF3306 domain-containing protein [Burkholderiales bacterium]|nr:DUF3306 domain-containing protein [Burkholderiales bacterium]
MSTEKESPLARWSRLKQERQRRAEVPAERPPAPAGQGDAPAQLPPLEQLTPESDFSAFMGPKVADALRRAALKKLFAHPQINLADAFEPFSGDWTLGEAIPEDMLARLQQAREALLRDPQTGAAAPPQDTKADEPAARDAEAEAEAPRGREQEQEARSEDVPRREDA